LTLTTETPALAQERATPATVYGILIAVSAAHFVNDTIQSLVPAIYPILKDQFRLDFGQIGIITLVWQLTASIFQPLVGLATDRRPQSYSLVVAMALTAAGLLLLARAGSYGAILAAVALVGLGSAVFHPESSRVARLASGGRHGFAQSIFQVGGNAGSAAGPLLAAFIVLPHGQSAIGWFAILALVGIAVLAAVGRWYAAHRRKPAAAAARADIAVPDARVRLAVLILALLVFSKYFYHAALSNYVTFYLIETFQMSVGEAQVRLFLFLAATAVGTLAGGPIGDRVGRRRVIWFSILGVLPFTLALPHLGPTGVTLAMMATGVILASAFPAIVVYAQELLPGRVGMVTGLFFGLAFGMGGLGGALLGELADRTSLAFMFQVCAFLPAIGLLAWFLPDVKTRRG
jgi:FSR family fosmidomycin resistance protein-like MFS transporter